MLMGSLLLPRNPLWCGSPINKSFPPSRSCAFFPHYLLFTPAFSRYKLTLSLNLIARVSLLRIRPLMFPFVMYHSTLILSICIMSIAVCSQIPSFSCASSFQSHVVIPPSSHPPVVSLWSTYSSDPVVLW